ncbi:MAG TPA: hypothetical protein VN643_04260 [Pyrinomonadaceae bacterium]|nr:hypothetical protein [Pyrinomonadaceae bacterium]
MAARSSKSDSLQNRVRAFLSDQKNRGLLFDIIIFFGNLFLLRLLTKQFIDLFQEVSAENPLAKLALGLTFLGMWILPALGAVLKRWHVHQRLRSTSNVLNEQSLATGCLFNPIFYFCLNLVITAFVLTGLGEFLFGRALLNNGALFVPIVIAGLVLTVFQTYLIYSYFSPPKKPPRIPFLLSPQSEMLGDVCLFLNMILFQVLWNLLSFAGLGRPSGVLEFAGRLFLLCFLALLIYFPPRMFYLAEDINKKRTWLTMLLANSPVIVRVLFGSSS